ncbi:protein tyrosine phosphatase [Stylonychia lemnae]|uniref:Protein tyrosine phosphatase n=1 Tax=Stylonychia lemnae TaxID=5949 RepID=A0A078AC02_STYLE|nr:protein tyrosine phosphatase [Stylonychia lemnae]|eukprot:CDW78308.1 protein tyrosine phosphatase [Stylonychia lemnae]
MYYQPTPINWQNYHFLIMSSPDNDSMKKCIKDLKTHKVKLLVRTCEKTYDEQPIKDAGIEIHENQFPDGQLPSKDTIKKWLATVDEFFTDENNGQSPTANATDKGINSHQLYNNIEKQTNKPKKSGDELRIGVHCVAGLGRAPFFVAIALVNNGCTPSNAIELIRKNRPGALNLTQANYILEFKGMSKKNKNKGKANSSCKCIIF